MCGTPITSKTILYKHIADHKLESKRLKGDTDNEESPKYTNLNVNDFVRYVQDILMQVLGCYIL